ncbi:MAG: zinc-binding dehydrogenase [Gammaproteobacteria bacterium]
MKAVLLNESGGPEALQTGEIPTPALTSATSVLIKLKAAGINPVDAKIRANVKKFPVPLPAVLGFDGAGIVAAVGNRVTRFQPNDEVYFCHPSFNGRLGTYGEYTVVEEHYLAHKPNALDFPAAAAVPLALITAWEALFDRAGLQAGQSVLIQGGAGGVGHLAVQLAKQAGAHVAATVSSKAKAVLTERLGADEAILYTDPDTAKARLQHSPAEGVDIVLDTVGGKIIEASFAALRYGGELVTLLQPDPDINWSLARQRNLRFSLELMLSPALLDMTSAQRAQSRILKQCAPRFDSGELQVVVAEQFLLADAAEAHRKLATGGFAGKLVLIMD